MDENEKGGENPPTSKKRPRRPEDVRDVFGNSSGGGERDPYLPYRKHNYMRHYPDNSTNLEYKVYVESKNTQERLGNKSPIYLNYIFTNIKGVVAIRRINANKIVVLFKQHNTANNFINNINFLEKHELKAYIPAAQIEKTGIIRLLQADDDDDDDHNHKSSLSRKSEPVILEYFEHGDTNAAAEDFLEFVTAKRSHLVCETIVEIALDHKPSHCEMASVLISDLYGRVFSAKDIGLAFERLLEKLPDLVLDTPDAAVLLSNFIARCVADDCLPPRFVQAHAAAELNAHAEQAIHRAETLLSMKQGLVRLDNIWGVGGGIRPVKWLIRQIQLLLKEYLTSGDLAEAMRCVRELEVPHFHHELVYETVLLAVESINSSVEEQLCTFLAELRRCVIVTPDQMDRGFERVLEDMSDIVLDVPLAYIMLDRFVERCQRRLRLGDHVLQRMPTRGRKRFVSESDCGVIKDHALKLREQ